jgi:hypothetical protein
VVRAVTIEPSWKDSIFRQREELARMLREPIALLGNKCASAWGDRERLNAMLLEGFSSIPYCTYLYVLGNDAFQISDSVGQAGIRPGYYQRNRAERPYMKGRCRRGAFCCRMPISARPCNVPR